MTDKEEKKSTTYENWRIKSELHREIGIASRVEGVPMYELAERAWQTYKQASTRTERDRDYEEVLVPIGSAFARAVAFLKVIFAPGFDEVIKDTVLRNLDAWVRQGSAKRGKSTKHRVG